MQEIRVPVTKSELYEFSHFSLGMVSAIHILYQESDSQESFSEFATSHVIENEGILAGNSRIARIRRNSIILLARTIDILRIDPSELRIEDVSAIILGRRFLDICYGTQQSLN